MTVELKEWDGAKYLHTRDRLAAYIEILFAEDADDLALLSRALRNVGRSEGLQQLAKEAGIDGAALAEGLSGQQLNFEAVHTLLKALGLQFRLQPAPVDEPSVV